MLKRVGFGILLLLSVGRYCMAQSAVPVGKGAYASTPPATTIKQVQEMQTRELFLLKEAGQPIPTNKWWTQLVVARYARSLWAYPLRVDTSEQGLDVFFPVRWQPDGRDPVCDLPLHVGARDFRPDSARAKDWSDWTCSFRMAETSAKYMDVTLGEGMPYLWIECRGVQPVLTLPGGVQTAFFDAAGRSGALPANGDCVGIRYKDRQFGIFTPDNTRFHLDHGKLGIGFTDKAQFLVICPLPAAKDIATFHRYAYAIPRGTQMLWQYDPMAARVTTTWQITTETLKGAEKRIIQGWIPHHYRNTTHDLAFNNIDYLSPRGKLRCAVGNRFVISYPYTGITPNLPRPARLGGAHDYDPARMHRYLAELAAKPQFGADTYWGGKDILRYGQCALMAQQTGDPTYSAFVGGLRAAMADWYTYRPGKKDHYFTYYPRWKALVGINPSYGSEGFNDHHFHYGYFTFASALLAMHDPQFAADYGGMAKLVAKDYANWDRSDQRFPFMRTFDIWAGHSWAGGTSSPGGNNQESSSEAVQSWAGLIYLGEALGDREMRDAGIMGYATETQAAMEYWFNAGGDVFPAEWPHPVNGMVWSGGELYGTYFTGDPAWIYAIQWLPASPMLSYLVRDPAFARKSYENMCRDYEAHEHEEAAKPRKPGEKPYAAHPAAIKSFGSGLGSVMLGYVLMYDPNWAAAQLDALWDTPGDDIAHNAGEMAVIYYQAHAMRALGLVDWSRHGSSPTSMVYYNAAMKRHTYIVWNPSAQPETVRFYEGQKVIGQLVAAPHKLTSATNLSPLTRL
jgi:endoglucanase Acf2